MKTLSNISRKLAASLCAILLAAFTMPCPAADYNRDLSVEKLKECKLMVINSHLLTKNWVYIDRNPDTPDKLALKKLHNEDFPKLKAELMELAKKWDESDRMDFESISEDINDLLFDYQKGIMRTLNSKANYNDDIIVMEAQEMIEHGGEKSATNDVIARIDMLIERITAADISQTVQPLFPNLSNLKGNSYTYETIVEQGASYEEAEKAAAMKIKRLQAKRLSIPIENISVEKLTPTTEILKNNVYEVFWIVENMGTQTTRITITFLVPKKNFAKQ